MAKRRYKGPGGKQLWENSTFAKGMLHTDETLREGFVKTLSNWNIARSGGSLETRGSLFSVLFKKPDDEHPEGLRKNTFTFRPQQDQDNIYYLNIGNAGSVSSKVKEISIHNIEVIDGDTIRDTSTGERYRLLGIDTPEEGDSYSKTAAHILIDCLRRVSYYIRESVVLFIDKGSTSSKDVYGRTMAFLYLDISGSEEPSLPDSDFGYHEHYPDDNPLSGEIDDVIGDETFLNMSSVLLATGYAKLMNEDEYEGPYYVPEYEYYGSGFDGLQAHRESAQSQSLGMWGDTSYIPSNNTLDGPDYTEEQTTTETECTWEQDGDSYSSSTDETTPNVTCESGATKTTCIPNAEGGEYSCTDYIASVTTTETTTGYNHYTYESPLSFPVPDRIRDYLSMNGDSKLVFYFEGTIDDLDGSILKLDFYDSEDSSSSRKGSIESSHINYHDDRFEISLEDLLHDVEEDVQDFDWGSQGLHVEIEFDDSVSLDSEPLKYLIEEENTSEQIEFDDGPRAMPEPNLSVFSHPQDYQLKQTDDDNISTPYVELEDHTRTLNFSYIFSDLGIHYEEPIRVELIKQTRVSDHEGLYDYYSEQYGLAHIPNIDGFAFIGRVVNTRTDETLYEGLMSIRYHVPMDGGEPDFKGYSFVVESYYRDNLYQIAFHNLGSGQSLNLLDSQSFAPERFIGQDALDNGYYTLRGLTLFCEDDEGNIMESLIPSETYNVRSYFAVPPLQDSSYDGYAIRWRVSSSEEDDGWKTLDWAPILDSDGEDFDLPDDSEQHSDLQNVPDGVFDAYREAQDSSLRDDFNSGDDYVVIDFPDTESFSKSSDNSLFNHVYRLEQVTVSMSRFKFKYEFVTSSYRQRGGDSGSMYYHFRLVVDESSLDLQPTSVSVDMDYSQNSEHRFTGNQHHMKPHTCRKISHFKGFTLLYDSPKHPETIFVSDEQNLDYFPYKYALDQFEEPVVHVHPHKDSFLVFTNTNVFMVTLELLEGSDPEAIPETVFRAQLVLSNMSIKRRHAHLVKSFGRDVLFYTGNSFYLLRPNQFVNDPSNMYLQRISAPIQAIFDNPTQFITRRLQYYGVAGNIFSQDWKPKLEHFVVIKNHEIWIYSSAYLEPVGESFMFISIFDYDNKLWRIYDTMAMSFPYHGGIFESDQGWQILLKNHPDIDHGVSLMLNEGFDTYDFQETDVDAGGVFDIKPLKLENGEFVYNSSEDFEDVKQPVNLFFDSGYLNISPQLNKRFHKTTLEFTNINAPTIDLAAEFNLDGRIRQTSNKVRMEHITDSNSDEYGTLKERYEFEPFVRESNEAVDGSITFNEWQLGIQKFGPLNKLRVTIPISGRGKIPGFEFGIRTHGQIKLFRHQVVFKEQRYR